MANFFKKIIDILLPPRCLECGGILGDGDGLCVECFNKINFISAPYCKKCGMPFENLPSGKKLLCGACLRDKKSPFRMIRSSFHYDDFSKNMILGFKFQDKTENAKVFAKWLKLAGKDIFEQGVDVIVPVPLHWSRLFKRRYNQSSLLARELSKISGVPVDYSSVIRHRKTKPQVAFSGRARVRNIKDAFMLKNAAALKGKRVLLIDDVMTTGSTLRECALVLKKAGAKSVDALSVART